MEGPVSLSYHLNEPLAPYTTFRIGGPADILLLPGNSGEFVRGLVWARANRLPVTVLGGGSNVLVADSGISGAVILTVAMREIQFAGPVVTAQAGAEMSDLSAACVSRGLAGLENFYGMPGTIGGAVCMNARCWGRSIADCLVDVTAAGQEGEIRCLTPAEMGLANKRSCFQDGGSWVLTVRLKLSGAADPEALRLEMEDFRRRREENGHYLFPNAGCIFKNNYELGIPSGKLIEQCGLKGSRVGAAEVFDRHANFIVNRGGATAADVFALIRRVETAVYEKTGNRLEREIRLLGRW